MDNNPVQSTPIQPTQQTPPAAVGPQPQVLTQQPPSPTQPDPESPGAKKMVWIIVGLVVLILAIGGIYLYMNRKPTPKVQTTPPQTTQVSTGLEEELNSLNVEAEENDFSEVDKDLQSL